MSNGDDSVNKTPIDPLHWDMILTSIYEGSCVPFLGAAVNISSALRKYTGLPLGPEVALRLISKMIGTDVEQAKQLAEVTVISKPFKNQGLDEDLARLWVQHLPRVALHVEVKGKGDRPYLTGRLREILADKGCTPSQLLEVLARLPLRLIVTTNFDRLLERAIEKALDEERSIKVSDFLGATSLVTKLRDGADPVAKHLAGQLSAPLRVALAAYAGPAEPPADLLATLATELDGLVHGPSLFESQRFAAVPLTAAIRTLARAQPGKDELLHLNRCLLEEAFPVELRRTRRGYHLVVQPVEGFEGNEQQTNPPGDDELVVYKIHGSFHEDGAANANRGAGVVITEEDYIHFLTIINEPVRGVPNHVVSKLANSTLLFLGYSLEDWDFRMLHKVLIEQRLTKHQRRSAFAIQWRPSKFWVEYWSKKQVEIYDCDIYDFAEDLERLYVERYGSLGARMSR